MQTYKTGPWQAEPLTPQIFLKIRRRLCSDITMSTVSIPGPKPKEHIECPSCKKSIPIYENEGRWCNHCEWNLEFETDDQKKADLYTRIYRSLGKRLSQKLFENLKQEKVARPRFTFAKFLAYSVAAAVHMTIILMLLAAYGVFQVFATPFAVFTSVLLLGITWIVLPKPRKLPKDVVPRDQAPKLYELLDRIADAMGTSRVYGVQIDEKYNAFYDEYGFGKWKKKYIGIGLPLAEAMTDEELVAVLSHETSHGANGDVARGVFLWSAMNSLRAWYSLLTPRQLGEGGTRRNLLWIAIANLIGALLGRIPWAACYLLTYLTYRQSQEAEYIADRLSTEVCGTEAAISLLYKVHRQEPFDTAVAKAALSRGKIDLFEEFKARMQQPQSAHDRERIDRLELRRGVGLDTTHPPAPYRRYFLTATSAFQPKVVLSPEESVAIRNELAVFRKDVAVKLVDEYLSSIYCL